MSKQADIVRAIHQLDARLRILETYVGKHLPLWEQDKFMMQLIAAGRHDLVAEVQMTRCGS